MKILTDEQAAFIARFITELMPDNMREYGWTEEDCDQLDAAFEALETDAPPQLQLRLTDIGPNDGEVIGPLQNVEVYPASDYIGIQRPGEEWEEVLIYGTGVAHVFVEVAGTEPGGAA